VAVRLQRRGGSGNGAGGRDEGDDGWRVELEVGLGVGVGWADEGRAERSVELGRSATKVDDSEWRAAVSSRRGADSQPAAAPDGSDCDCAALPMLPRCMLILTRLFVRV